MHGNPPINLLKPSISVSSMNGAHNSHSDHSLTGPQIIDQMVITPESFVIGQSNICVSKPN